MEEQTLNHVQNETAGAPAAGSTQQPAGNPYAQQGAGAEQKTGLINPYAGQTGPQAFAAAGATAFTSPVKKRQPFELKKRDLIFAGLVSAVTLFGVIAGVWGGFRLGFAAAFLTAFVLLSVYLGKGRRPTAFGAVCGALALALTPAFVLTSNEAVRFFSVLGAAALAVIWLATLSGRKIPAGDLGLAAAFFDPLLDILGNLDRTFRGLFSGGARRKGTAKVLLGLVCAVPVLCAVVPLLMQSDAAFEGLLKNVFTDLGRTAAQLLAAVLLLPLILSFAYSLRKQEKALAAPKEGKGLDTAFLASFLAALGIAYAVYLCSQFAYFFDSFKGILPEGYSFSYADYARRGFFELCGVAAINLAVLLAVLLLSRKKEGRLPAVLKGLGVYLSLFTLLLIGTALAKMAMYINKYGMTVLRLGVSAVSAVMAVVFIAVILRLFIPRARVLQTGAVAAALALAALGICNVNGVCARYNYNAYVSGQLADIDLWYLSELGPEGVPYLVKIVENEKETAEHRRLAAYLFHVACTDEIYENEWDDSKYPTPKTDFTYGDGYRFAKPLKHQTVKLSEFSLPMHRAKEAADAFTAKYPDFLEREDYLRSFYADEWGYFDPEDQTPPLPDYLNNDRPEEPTASAAEDPGR